MDYLLTSLLSLINAGVAKIMELMGGAALALLRLDLSSDNSVFGAVFFGFKGLDGIIMLMSLAILVLIYGFQLVKIMYSPSGGGDTPLGLTARTFVAGVLMYYAMPLLGIVEKLFRIFYDAIMVVSFNGVQSSASVMLNLENFGNAMLEGAAVALAPGVVGTAVAAASLASALFMLIMTLIIAWQFFMFILECVERYVVLGTLFYMSPLAFSMSGSNATNNVFSSWVRMVLSQMFLMVTNVIFFRIFIAAFQNMDSSVAELMVIDETVNGASAFSMINCSIVWTFLMFAILKIACQMDTYLANIGLCTAQTGAGLGRSMVGAAMTVMTLSKTATSAVTGVRKGISGISNAKGAKVPLSRNDTGAVSQKSVIANADGRLSKRDAEACKGSKYGEGLATVMPAITPMYNTASAVSNSQTGVATMSTFPDKSTGMKPMRVQMAPLQGDNKTSLQPGAIQGRISKGEDGSKYLNTISGGTEQSRMNFLTQNQDMDKMMKNHMTEGSKRTDGNSHFADKVLDSKGVDTGVRELGVKDKAGNVVESRQYAPTSVYQPDQTMPTAKQMVGEMEYCVTDTTELRSGASLTTTTPLTTNDNSPGNVQSIKEQFGENVLPTNKPVQAACATQGMSDVITMSDGTSTYAMAPVAHYTTSSQFASEIVKADNGASYSMVKLGEGQTARDAFAGRSDTIYAEKLKSFTGDLNDEKAHSKMNNVQNPNILRGAFKKANAKKGK